MILEMLSSSYRMRIRRAVLRFMYSTKGNTEDFYSALLRKAENARSYKTAIILHGMAEYMVREGFVFA